MDSKGNQLVKKRLLKFWVVLGLYGLPTGSATALLHEAGHLFHPFNISTHSVRL